MWDSRMALMGEEPRADSGNREQESGVRLPSPVPVENDDLRSDGLWVLLRSARQCAALQACNPDPLRLSTATGNNSNQRSIRPSDSSIFPVGVKHRRRLDDVQILRDFCDFRFGNPNPLLLQREQRLGTPQLNVFFLGNDRTKARNRDGSSLKRITYLPSSNNGMATSLPSFYVLSTPSSLPKARRSLHVKAHSSGDKGKSVNIVDANMSLLRERIEEVRMHERLKSYCRGGEGSNYTSGWNYTSGYDSKLKNEKKLSDTLEVAGLIAGTFGFTFLSGTLCLCLLSIFVHLGQ
ncbi:hypothetical protein MRB53_028326 [Persea americana]|uniref:Uncharacterized protein n=1 Tax=Persea americana TaxID=3435 RepID=A0ACC2KF58_PERAE|nr:hypothetical protein MRB53_028326 [Persea americana]